MFCSTSPQFVQIQIEETELNKSLVDLVEASQIACFDEDHAYFNGLIELKEIISEDIPYKYGDEKKLPSCLHSQIKKTLLSIPWQNFMTVGSAMYWSSKNQTGKISDMFEKARSNIKQDLKTFYIYLHEIILAEQKVKNGIEIPDFSKKEFRSIQYFAQFYIMYLGFGVLSKNIEELNYLWSFYKNDSLKNDFLKTAYPNEVLGYKEKYNSFIKRRNFLLFSMFLKGGEVAKLLRNNAGVLYPKKFKTMLTRLVNLRDLFNHDLANTSIKDVEKMQGLLDFSLIGNIVDNLKKIIPLLQKYDRLSSELTWQDRKKRIHFPLENEDILDALDGQLCGLFKTLKNQMSNFKDPLFQRREDRKTMGEFYELKTAYENSVGAKKQRSLLKLNSAILNSKNSSFIQKYYNYLWSFVIYCRELSERLISRDNPDILNINIMTSFYDSSINIPYLMNTSFKLEDSSLGLEQKNEEFIFHLKNLKTSIQGIIEAISTITSRALLRDETAFANFYIVTCSTSLNYVAENLKNIQPSATDLQKTLNDMIKYDRNRKAHLHVLIEARNQPHDAMMAFNIERFDKLLKQLKILQTLIENS